MLKPRVLLAGLLGAALLLPASAAVSAPAPTRLPGGSYTGSWQGQTNQDRVIKFNVNGANVVTYLVVGYKVSGGYCSVAGKSTLKNLSSRINSEQKFRVSKTIANTSIIVRGTMLSASKARGRLHVEVTDPTGYGCAGELNTGWVAHKG